MRNTNNSEFEDAVVMRNGIYSINDYEPSREATMMIARDYEKNIVRLNRDLAHSDATTNLVMRQMIGVTATTAASKYFSQMVPEAAQRLDALADMHGQVEVDILAGWRRRRHE